MIDKAFYLRHIDVWNTSQPEGPRLSLVEMESLAEHLYGNAAQLLVWESEAKDAAFKALLEAAQWLHPALDNFLAGEFSMTVDEAIGLLETTGQAIEAAEALAG